MTTEDKELLLKDLCARLPELVGVVIRRGRISKKGDKIYYCWATQITYRDEDYTVYVRDNRKSDCFVVTKSKTVKNDTRRI